MSKNITIIGTGYRRVLEAERGKRQAFVYRGCARSGPCRGGGVPGGGDPAGRRRKRGFVADRGSGENSRPEFGRLQSGRYKEYGTGGNEPAH
jgi:hypothetical protein